MSKHVEKKTTLNRDSDRQTEKMKSNTPETDQCTCEI